ncbi:hypothetical protein HPB52_014027 [Rhipicephalus sanguineus]|uniref:Uncharacterized protein n=1 Tax=Rhipicephalus sanguineus TaxID=34632 RepID=A0A9D4SWZ9_RHISA|nr:hypothetical protein HPB52_014027 [Rhipicephalus sanguineus]
MAGSGSTSAAGKGPFVSEGHCEMMLAFTEEHPELASSTGGGRLPGFRGQVLQLTGTIRLSDVTNLPYQEQADVPATVMEVVIETTDEAAGVRSAAICQHQMNAQHPPRAAAPAQRKGSVSDYGLWCKQMDQVSELQWNNLRLTLPVKKKNRQKEGELLLLRGSDLPEQQRRVLQLGPKYCIEPSLSTPEMLVLFALSLTE